MAKYKQILTLLFVFLLLIGGSNTLLAQMKIGDNSKSVQPSSILELESTKKGLLLSRLSDTVLINALNPPNGMVIYYNGGSHQAMMVRRYNRWVDVVTSDSLSTYIQSLSKNITSGSPVIAVQNGTGATLQSVVVNLNTSALGHLLTGTGLNDSLAIALTKGSAGDSLLNIISRNSVNAVNASNGLTKVSSNNIVLGGVLTQPTTITTSAANTLTVTGLQNGDAANDSVVVSEANTGILKKVSANSFSVSEKQIEYIAINGQVDFATPYNITDVNKITVYRNGVAIGFIQKNANTITLESDVICAANDEIRIVQFN